jgi:subtilisin-like proprotein convertase family protein
VTISGANTAVTAHSSLYNLSAVDPENDAITFSATTTNGTATVTGTVLTFTPSGVAPASAPTIITVVATDSYGAASAAKTIAIVVTPNQAPHFTSAPPASGTVGTAMSYSPICDADPEGDTITITKTAGPGTFTAGVLSYTPVLADVAASPTFTFSANDSHTGVTVQTFTLPVASNPTPLPTITGFSPIIGPVGTSVTITGTNFSTASAVAFNGVSATFATNSSTQITATVPSTTSGAIAVTTPGGTATSATAFTVTTSGSTPTITGLSVASALPGQAVLIAGTNLGGATAVRFNGTAALFIQDSASQITTLVPAGATTGSVTVQTPGGTATSPAPFTVSANPTNQQNNTTVTAIPDAPSVSVNGTVVLIPFTISGLSYPIKDVKLSIYITHTFVGDLDLQLIAPDNTAISLAASRDDAGHNYGTGCAPGQYTVFSDSAAGPLSGGSPYVGTYKPDQPLSTFAGKIANGTWNLQIQDQGPADTGSFMCASLQVTAAPQPPTITGFNPTMGPSGTTVLLTGTHLSGTTALTIGNVAAASPTNVTDTSLTFTVPSGAPVAPIRLTTPAGIAISNRTFTPTASGTTGDLFIDGAYVTQSAQNYTGAVPLVAGKDGVLRIFVRGNQAGITAPSVRVRTYNGATLTATQIIAPMMATTPMVMSEASLTQSWNYTLPGASIQPGFGLLLDVDPTNTIAEADETNNTWPASGTPMAMDVRTLQAFHGTLIPVTQSGLTGDATSGNLASWYARFQKMYPIAPGMDVVLGAAYTTSQVLVSAGGGWSALLTELEAKRVVEASSRYYYGALNVSYASGVAGLGYVPNVGSSSPRSAMGWDKTSGYSDGGLYFDVLTHETGHNMGRAHSPCGNPANPDPAYPYAGALIGINGLDVATMTLKDPTIYKDIMAYCSPVWVSDYVYGSILNFRQASPYGIPPTAAPSADGQPSTTSVQDCLLISGRIHNGNVELDPALQVRTVPTAIDHKAFHGSRLIEGRDASGSLLFQRSVSLIQVADDIPGSQIQHFITAIPVKDFSIKQLNELRVLGGSGPEAVRWSSNVLPLMSGAVQMPQAKLFGEGEVRLTWDAIAHPLVMVRDAITGDVLSFARGGDMVIKTPAKQLELTLSSGVTSEKMVLNILD